MKKRLELQKVQVFSISGIVVGDRLELPTASLSVTCSNLLR